MRDGWRSWLISIILALGTFILYAPVAGFDFVWWDDPFYIIQNSNLAGALSWHKVAWCFQNGYGGNWIPLVWLSYVVEYHFFGPQAAAYHVTNAVLHAANAVLLFLVLTKMTRAPWRSAMVAALFAWHPMHVESVAWISERKDVLSTFFWMLTMWAYVTYAQKGGVVRYALVLLFFALGLMSKSMLVTLPFVLLLLDWWPLCRFQTASLSAAETSGNAVAPGSRWQMLVIEKIPLIVLSAAGSLITILLQSQAGAIATLDNFSILARITNVLLCYCLYIKKLIWPVRLSPMYPIHIGVSSAIIVGAIIFLAAVSDRAFGLRRKFPYLTVGWLWYLGTMAPVIGIVQIGAQGMADRYTYIPAIGLFLMVAWGGSDLLDKGFARIGDKSRETLFTWTSGGVCLAVAVAYGLTASRQLQYWRSSATLFSRALAIEPNNYAALNAYGLYLSDHGALPEAIADLRKAIQLNPNGPNGHATLGHALYLEGKLDEAADELRLALQLDPTIDYTRNELASVLIDKNLPEEAIGELSIILRRIPGYAEAHYLMGRAELMQGKLDDAEQQLTEALRLKPQYAEAHIQLARSATLRHDTPRAIVEYNAALNLQPDLIDALNNLAWILATSPAGTNRNGLEAVRLARRACELTHDEMPVVIGTLAAAYAEAGDFDNAIASAQKAHDLALAQGQEKLAAKNTQLLALFRSRHAYQE